MLVRIGKSARAAWQRATAPKIREIYTSGHDLTLTSEPVDGRKITLAIDWDEAHALAAKLSEMINCRRR